MTSVTKLFVQLDGLKKLMAQKGEFHRLIQ